ncbi:hypothetical protein BGZ76_007956 [Entomortierella beljakovae]|nr:hypothetical protein BGZ76_007956 [Entomortierella beljakovae]
MTFSVKLFELVDGKTRKISFSPAVWRANPNITAPTAPTLQIAPGEGLQDSLAIAEYLDEKYPDRPLIFGASPSEKKLQLFFQSYVQAKLHPAIMRLVFEGIYDMQDPENAHYFRTSREKSAGMPYQEIPGDRAANLKELIDGLGLIHNALKSSPWILGDTPGWADFVIASSFAWFSSCSPENFKEGVLDAFDDQIFASFWERIQEYA